MRLTPPQPVSEEKLLEILLARVGVEGRATLEAMAGALAGAIDPLLAAGRVVDLYASLPEEERRWAVLGISAMAVAGDRLLLELSAEAIERLSLRECLPALNLAFDNYPRRFGLVLRQKIGHTAKQLRESLRELPLADRMRWEMDNTVRRGALEYSEPESRASHAARWLADYMELIQRRRGDFEVCRSWILEQLDGDDRTARLAALELCGVFRIREAVPILERLAETSEFRAPETLEARALASARSQLGG